MYSIGGNFPKPIRDWMDEQFKSVNAVELNGIFYIHGMQAAEVLEYQNSSVIDDLDKKDKLEIPSELWKEWVAIGEYIRDFKIGDLHIVILNNAKQNYDDSTFISFSALTNLILDSNKPNTHKFKQWVFKEVIPSVTALGAYMTPEKIKQVERTEKLKMS